MSYYFSKRVEMSFDDAVTAIIEALKARGFGILTDIDIKATFKEKLDVDFRKYRILGACNPPFAYKSLNAEDKIGLLLPCNVIVQEHENGGVEIAAIDPIVSMAAVGNQELAGIAGEVQKKLADALESV